MFVSMFVTSSHCNDSTKFIYDRYIYIIYNDLYPRKRSRGQKLVVYKFHFTFINSMINIDIINYLNV